LKSAPEWRIRIVGQKIARDLEVAQSTLADWRSAAIAIGMRLRSFTSPWFASNYLKRIVFSEFRFVAPPPSGGAIGNSPVWWFRNSHHF
jgi:hypothetical protein